MFALLEGFKSFFLLSIGAIAGCWIRMHLTSFFGSIFSAKYWGTLLVNIFATFFLGLFIALQSHSGFTSVSDTSPLFIFICVGFLGSLSTFSTFILELLDILLDRRWKVFLPLSLCSLFGGFLAALAGLTLGNV